MIQPVGIWGREGDCAQTSIIKNVWTGLDKDNYFVFLDVLMFFIRNPSAIETPGDVALRVCRPIDQALDVIDVLITEHIVEVKGLLWGERYVALTSNPMALQEIQDFSEEYLTSKEKIKELYKQVFKMKQH